MALERAIQRLTRSLNVTTDAFCCFTRSESQHDCEKQSRFEHGLRPLEILCLLFYSRFIRRHT